MADFCNYCAEHMFGKDFLPDIDVHKEFEKLEEDHFINVGICEGCGLVLVANIKGQLKVHYVEDEELSTDVSNQTEIEKEIIWEDYVDKFHIS